MIDSESVQLGLRRAAEAQKGWTVAMRRRHLGAVERQSNDSRIRAACQWALKVADRAAKPQHLSAAGAGRAGWPLTSEWHERPTSRGIPADKRWHATAAATPIRYLNVSKVATVGRAQARLSDLAPLTKEQDYVHTRPALTYRKLRQLELAAGAPKRSNRGGHHGPPTPDTPSHGPANAPTPFRSKRSYRAAVGNWKPQRPPTKVT